MKNLNLKIGTSVDGKPNKLYRFSEVVESILVYYSDKENINNFLNIKLMNGIINKLHATASEEISRKITFFTKPLPKW